jgi:uncharacterized damage-inducible protein DinB
MKDNMIISQDALLEQWQGHRRLTRRVIETFPEDKLFSYSVGGMRPFAELAQEMLGMAVPTLNGAVTGTWAKAETITDQSGKPATREALLRLWDETTEEINRLWPQITPERFQETDLAFGQWEGTIYWVIFYIIDNEIHHRGQGYVYLRTLGIEPPGFWLRD